MSAFTSLVRLSLGVVTCLALSIPPSGSLAAQGGRGRGGAAGRGGGFGQIKSPAATLKDNLEHNDPVAFLLDRKKPLALSWRIGYRACADRSLVGDTGCVWRASAQPAQRIPASDGRYTAATTPRRRAQASREGTSQPSIITWRRVTRGVRRRSSRESCPFGRATIDRTPSEVRWLPHRSGHERPVRPVSWQHCLDCRDRR